MFMKKSLLFLSLFLASVANAQDCSKIFISEYVEGWSNNKAMEIYNPTPNPVNLAEYFVARYSNGSSSAQVKHSVQLSGTVAPYDVFVAVLEKLDPNGTGQEAPIWDSLQARADGYFSPDYNISQAFYWNGDDAVVLVKGTLTANPDQVVTTIPGIIVIDIFGKIGEQPTNDQGTTSPAGGWSTDFPYTGMNGTIVTQDHSLIRKSTIKKGEINPAISFFNPLLEWDSIPAVIVRLDPVTGDTVFGTTGNPILDGNWTSLGSHNCACDPATQSIDENKKNILSIYPNPSQGTFQVNGLANVSRIVVLNALGQKVETLNVSGKVSTSFNLDLKGVYFVQFTTNTGETITKKVIVK
jgi:Lamin Tail Domain/Secretion system C-terminal sorting domain